MSFNDGFDPLDFGGDLLSGINPKKRRKKGTFDEIFDLAGIGNDPFLGFGKTGGVDDFAIPTKRKRRSREAVLLGIREDAESPIFGLQFLGNTVGTTESIFTSKQFRSKLKRDKKAITDTFGTEIGRFKTDESGKIKVDEKGRPIRSKEPEDLVLLGRTLNPRIKQFVDTKRTKRRTSKNLKKNLRQSEFGTASPSGLTQPEPLEFLSSEGKPVRTSKQKPEDEVFTPQGRLASTPKEKNIIEQATKPIGSKDQLGDFGVFQMPKLEEEEMEKLRRQNENKQKLRKTVSNVVFGTPTVLKEIGESKPVAALRKKPIVLTTDEGKKFVVESARPTRSETAGGRLLESISGISERIEKEPTKPFSKTGKKTDLSPVGEQAEIRIEKERRRSPEQPLNVAGFFEKRDEETRIPKTFADAEENGVDDTDENMKDFTDPDETKTQNLNIKSSEDEDEFSDLIFRGEKPVTLSEESKLIEERKKGQDSFRGFISQEKTERPKVKKSDVFETTDLQEDEFDEDIDDKTFDTLGRQRALPTEAQSFFEKQKEPQSDFTQGLDTDFTKTDVMSEEEKDKKGIVNDFGDILEQAGGAKDLGIGTSDLGTADTRIQTEQTIPRDFQTKKEPEFDTSFNDNDEKKDGIRPDIDRRSSLTGGLRILSTIDKIQKDGVVNNPVRKITEDPSVRNEFLRRVAGGQISEEGIQEELDILTDPDIPKATRTRKRRTLKNALKVIRSFKQEREGKPTPLVDKEIDPDLQVSDTTKQVFEQKLESDKPSFKKEITKDELKKQVFRENAIVPVESVRGTTDKALFTEKVESDESDSSTKDVITDVKDEKEDARLRTRILTKGKRLFNLAKKSREKGTTVEDEEEEEEKLREKAEELERKEERKIEERLKAREKQRERERLREQFRKDEEDFEQ